MTENEAKGMLQAKLTCMELEDLACPKGGCFRNCDNCKYNYTQGMRGEQKETIKIAVKALEELQQYRTIGTVAECRDAMEKQRTKKPVDSKIRKVLGYFQCPVCGGLLTTRKYFCEDCGQAISWEHDTE